MIEIAIPSLFDFLIVAILGWGIYNGYKRGFVVQVISLFALLASIFIAVKLTDLIHIYLSDKSTVKLNQLPVILFTIFFGLIVWETHIVAQKVEASVGDLKQTTWTKGLGALFAAVKYLFIVGIFLIFLYRLNVNFDYIPQAEKNRTHLFKPIRKIPPLIFPYLEFNTVHYQPFLIPEDENTPETTDETDPYDSQDDF